MPPQSPRLLRHPIFALWLCAFAWWAGRWFWVWWPAPPASIIAATAPIADSGRLRSAQVFGNGNGVRAEASTEGLRLVGVNTDTRLGFALIEANGKSQAVVRGDTLADGRRVTDIAGDRLVLERDGQREFLSLDRRASR